MAFSPMSETWLCAPCREPSAAHAEQARARQALLTKPPGSLGRLEELAIDLAGLQHTSQPSASLASIIIFAGDHGVTAQGVSAFPAEVTVQMVINFAAGGAAIAVLARELGAPLTVIDAGTRAGDPIGGTVTDKPRCGTRDFSQEPAMTRGELDHAFACGQRAMTKASVSGRDLVILGEMGIGNTSAAAAIACGLTGQQPADIVGGGTGLDAAGQARKVKIVREAITRYALRSDGFDSAPAFVAHVLTCVGGFEIAAMTGAMIAAAQCGVPVLVDGFIVTVAALAAVRLNPSCRPWLIFAHCSAERGHRAMLEALEARPVLDLGMRLGEGSGAALALPILRLACALHNGMATFAQASVSNRSAP